MSRWAPWSEAGVEPNIIDVLSDPIVHTLMRADGVHIADLLAIIGGDDRSAAERDRFYPNEPGFDWTHGISARQLSPDRRATVSAAADRRA